MSPPTRHLPTPSLRPRRHEEHNPKQANPLREVFDFRSDVLSQPFLREVWSPRCRGELLRDLGVRGEAARGETELLAKVVEAVVEEEVEPDCVGVVQVGLGGEAVGRRQTFEGYFAVRQLFSQQGCLSASSRARVI